jgi:riboflavin synthase
MFTGIVEELGTVAAIEDQGDALRLTFRATTALEGTGLGDSIAVNGCCLTVAALDGDTWTADLMQETLDMTSLAGVASGDRVNLERAMTPDKRLGGHLVQGHVDGVGTVDQVADRGDARLLDLRVPDEVARVSVPLGSIAVDGVSLTVNAIPVPGVVQISLIPFTLQHTTLGERQPGDRVHLEADTIGKYVAELLRARGDLGAS